MLKLDDLAVSLPVLVLWFWPLALAAAAGLWVSVLAVRATWAARG